MGSITLGGNLKKSDLKEFRKLLKDNGLGLALPTFKKSKNRIFKLDSDEDFIDEFQDFCEDYDLYYIRLRSGSDEDDTVPEMSYYDPTTKLTQYCMCTPDGTLLMDKEDVLQIIDIVKEFMSDTNKALLSINDNYDVRRAGIAKILIKNPNLDPFSVLTLYINESYPAPPELPDFKILK